MDPKFLMRIGLQHRFPRFPSAVSARLIGIFEGHFFGWFPVSYFFLVLVGFLSRAYFPFSLGFLFFDLCVSVFLTLFISPKFPIMPMQKKGGN